MEPAQWSAQEAAFQLGVDYNTLKRRLVSGGVKIGRGVKHRPSTIYEALTTQSNSVNRLAAAKLKNSEEEARLKELDRLEREKELVQLEEAKQMIIVPFRAVSQKIKDMPARLAGQCNPGDPVLAREVLDDAVREVCNTVKDVCSKL